MPYLITNLWKLPNLDGSSEAQAEDQSAKDDDSLMAAACRDCNQYNFPPKAQCRYCGSPRIRTVQLSGNIRPNPGTWIFGAAEASTSEKPN
jgi:ribosomal protein L40E